MAQLKLKYAVYRQFILEAEEPENGVEHDKEFMGYTYAVSEKQAINNIKHRMMGNVSQYKPLAVSGHWAYWCKWTAELVQ